MDAPFDIVVYDKTFTFQGFVVDPIYVHMAPHWSNQGYGSFMVSADNPHAAALQTKGARVTVDYLGKTILSGPIRSYIGDALKNGTVTYQVLDDRRILENTLGWVAPKLDLAASSLSDLGQAYQKPGTTQVVGTVKKQYGYYMWPTGAPVASAEAAIKHVLRENLIDRLGLPITIAANQGLGGNPASVLPKFRFELLSEILTPLLKFSGLGVTFRQDRMAKTINMDVVSPSIWDAPITPESGIITAGSYSVRAPDATRVVVGGPGDPAPARIYQGTTQGTARTALEALWGDVIEVYRDGNGPTLEWPDDLEDKFKVAKYYPFRAATADVTELLNALKQEEKDALADGAPTTGIALKLAETETFKFGGGDGIQLGDQVTAVVNGVSFVDQVTECFLTFTRDKGMVVQPIVGQYSDDPDIDLAKQVVKLQTAIRKLSSSQ